MLREELPAARRDGHHGLRPLRRVVLEVAALVRLFPHRQPRKLWETTFRDSKRLGIEDRIVES